MDWDPRKFESFSPTDASSNEEKDHWKECDRKCLETLQAVANVTISGIIQMPINYRSINCVDWVV